MHSEPCLRRICPLFLFSQSDFGLAAGAAWRRDRYRLSPKIWLVARSETHIACGQAASSMTLGLMTLELMTLELMTLGLMTLGLTEETDDAKGHRQMVQPDQR